MPIRAATGVPLDQEIRHAPNHFFHERQASPADASSAGRNTNVFDSVSNEGHGPIHKICYNNLARLSSLTDPTILSQKLHMQMLDVQMHARMAFTFRSDEADFLAAVTISDWDSEKSFNEFPFMIQQHHGSRDDPFGRDSVYA
jgi:hypothetical protein